MLADFNAQVVNSQAVARALGYVRNFPFKRRFISLFRPCLRFPDMTLTKKIRHRRLGRILKK